MCALSKSLKMLVAGTRRGSDSVGSGGFHRHRGHRQVSLVASNTAPNTLVLVPKKVRTKSDVESGTAFSSDA